MTYDNLRCAPSAHWTNRIWTNSVRKCLVSNVCLISPIVTKEALIPWYSSKRSVVSLPDVLEYHREELCSERAKWRWSAWQDIPGISSSCHFHHIIRESQISNCRQAATASLCWFASDCVPLCSMHPASFLSGFQSFQLFLEIWFLCCLLLEACSRQSADLLMSASNMWVTFFQWHSPKTVQSESTAKLFSLFFARKHFFAQGAFFRK